MVLHTLLSTMKAHAFVPLCDVKKKKGGGGVPISKEQQMRWLNTLGGKILSSIYFFLLSA